MANDVNVLNVLKVFLSCTSNPGNFTEVQHKVATQLEGATKDLYDATKILETDTTVGDALPELITDNFDNEQVWQELELQNAPSIDALLASVSRAVASKSLTFAAVRSKEKTQVEVEESDEEVELDDEVEEDAEASDGSEDDIGDLRLDVNGSDIESEEEKELQLLLDKAHALGGDESNDDDDEELLLSDSDADEKSTSETVRKGILKPDAAPTKKRNKSKTKSVVDDRFFKLSDMEAFLEQEDAKEGRKTRKDHGEEVSSSEEDEEEEEVDMFGDFPSDGDEESSDKKRLNYDDFFDPPSDVEDAGLDKAEKEGEGDGKKEGKKVKFSQRDQVSDEENASEDEADVDADGGQKQRPNLLDDVDDDEGMLDEVKSSFEKRQQRLKKKVAMMEAESISDKPWQLWGEIASNKRPENSLLQEDLDFEHTTRPAPAITEETTMKLEDLIKQRIKDQTWDDVERQTKQVDTPFEYKKRVVLDQEKSKLSLGEIYEAEFVKQTQTEDGEVKVDPQHEIIRKMTDSLFLKLDALSNFHYTPRPAAPEIKIVSNQPAIAMEEVAPVSVSDTALLAPQEIQEKTKTELKGSTEKTETDKKRELRMKKKTQRARRLNREHKEKIVKQKNLVSGNKLTKEQALREFEKQGKFSKSVHIIKDDKAKKNLSSSKQFFGQLQEEVNTHIKKKRDPKEKKEKENNFSSTKLKL